MEPPVSLSIPDYFNVNNSTHSEVALLKTISLTAGDDNKARLYASVEARKNYQYKVQAIEEKYREIATSLLQRDIANEWELPVTISGCKLYSYHWDDAKVHFRMYWIIISEDWLLQITGVFDPAHSRYYKTHFMTFIQQVNIDTGADFTTLFRNKAPIFSLQFIPVETAPLAELMVETSRQKEVADYLKESLNITHPDFLKVLQQQLAQQEEATITNFICTSWNLLFNLGNPENFEDPDDAPEWYDPGHVLTYYETPYTKPAQILILSPKGYNSTMLNSFIKNIAETEERILIFAEQYTFGDGGAYAAGKHFRFAKKAAENLLNKTFTNKEFLTKNLCLRSIELTDDADKIIFDFHCSWDEEHGWQVSLSATDIKADQY